MQRQKRNSKTKHLYHESSVLNLSHLEQETTFIKVNGQIVKLLLFITFYLLQTSSVRLGNCIEETTEIIENNAILLLTNVCKKFARLEKPNFKEAKHGAHVDSEKTNSVSEL